MKLGNHGLRYSAAFVGLLLAWSPASARTCEQQTFLNAARRVGPRTEKMVRQDQLKLQTFENEVVRSLLQFGFSESELRKLLAGYEASAPAYCFVTPDIRRNRPIQRPQAPEKARAQLRDIIATWRKKFGIGVYATAKVVCSDCSIAELWRIELQAARDPLNISGKFSEFEEKYRRVNFAKIHRDLTNATIGLLIEQVNYYTL